MRPRLGGAERRIWATCAAAQAYLQCGRAWGARRGPRSFDCLRPVLSLQCGRAWGARRGTTARGTVTVTVAFNVVVFGGCGEGHHGCSSRYQREALQCGRAWGARRGEQPRRRLPKKVRLQCGRAWGARRGTGSPPGPIRCPCFNAAAPGGRGEARTPRSTRHRAPRFNAAAPGGRGEAGCSTGTPPAAGSFNAAAPGGRGEAAFIPASASWHVWLQCGRAWGARRGSCLEAGATRTLGFNAAAPGGRGEGRGPRHRSGRRPGFNAAAPGGRGEGHHGCSSRYQREALQCGRAWGARRGRNPQAPRTRPGSFNAAAPGGRGEDRFHVTPDGPVHASMRPRLGGAERRQSAR